MYTKVENAEHQQFNQTEARVLTLLSKPLSLQALASELKFSRFATLKTLQTLQSKGMVEIVSKVPLAA
ncbi:MAG: hypothetical protein AAGF01_12555 [Cyanobacteria bacterium P01_G01_bin.38]